jgi:5S rRNA maturation endonuclease (ribonuclease M5)
VTTQVAATTTKKNHLSASKLNALSDLLCNDLDHLFSELNLNLRKDFKKYHGCCPVHDGNNITAFNLYHGGHTFAGKWTCYTNKCHDQFQPTILGFIRGVLTRQKALDTPLPFQELIDWCLKFLKITSDDIKIDVSLEEKRKFIRMSEMLSGSSAPKEEGWSHDDYCKCVDKTQTQYFEDRGFSKEVLGLYHVGLSKNTNVNSLAYNRLLVPIYNESGRRVVGAQGRSLYPKCPKCELYHDPTLPCPSLIKTHTKWVNIPENFEISHYYYNMWLAKPNIKQSRSVILVEGAPNVWRLYEAGYLNSLALCGSTFNDARQIALENLGVETIYSFLDNDDAGKAGFDRIYQMCRRQFKVKQIEFPTDYNDVAEMSVEKTRKVLVENKCLF